MDVQSAGERADLDPALLIGERKVIARVLEPRAFARVGRAAVIDQQHPAIGVVSLMDPAGNPRLQRGRRREQRREPRASLNRNPPRLAAAHEAEAVAMLRLGSSSLSTRADVD
jgi:hypothetical protein